MSGTRADPGERLATAAAAAVVLQSLAAAFFIADALVDARNARPGLHVAMELVIAMGLLCGVAVGAVVVRRLWTEGRRRKAALDIASGALAEVTAARFRDWGLSPAESDVAAFALKGCDVAEIAGLRGAAEGTVRAQLAQVYRKAGVNSRAGLACLFLEDLIPGPASPGPKVSP